MKADEILKKYEDANEMHFHQVDRGWIIEAMEEYAALRQPHVSGVLIGKKIKYKGIEQTIIDTNETEELVITDKSIPDGIKLLWSNVELLF